MRIFIVLIATLIASFLPSLARGEDRRPSYWGGGLSGYRVKLDNEVKLSGSTSVSLTRTSTAEEPRFGTIVQAISAGPYAGKRLQLSGFIKTEDAESAGLWLRVDSKERGTVGFDNMHSRRIKGTTDWYKYEIVVDVPDDASMLTFGALLSGAGKIWVDDLSISEASDDVETTVDSMRPTMQRFTIPVRLSDSPRNMDFET